LSQDVFSNAEYQLKTYTPWFSLDISLLPQLGHPRESRKDDC